MPLQRNMSFMLISPNTNIENIRYSEIKYSINNGSVCFEHMTYLLVEFARFPNISAQWLDWIFNQLIFKWTFLLEFCRQIPKILTQIFNISEEELSGKRFYRQFLDKSF